MIYYGFVEMNAADNYGILEPIGTCRAVRRAYRIFTPSQTKFWEGYLFRGVCACVSLFTGGLHVTTADLFKLLTCRTPQP